MASSSGRTWPLVASIASLRIGAYDMAVGNLFGSNVANMSVFLFADLAYTEGPILAAVSETQAIAAVGAILLMAIAVGASCAFLTPIGHQNNALILGPGGYRFGDYWRLGLPLEILIVLVAVPLLLVVWPL